MRTGFFFMKQIFRGLVWCAAIVMVYRVLINQSGIWEQIVKTKEIQQTIADAGKEEQKFIVIDSGHGFFDGGKTGISGRKEKEINLAIAQKLKIYLQDFGFEVRMTRENDTALYDGVRPSDKKEDMRKRVELMNAEGCLLAVSVHQNSFSEEKYSGAQVFYYEHSESSRKLAEAIQRSLVEFQNPDNTRKEKGNADYYLLKKGTVPTVICECGFLSNAREEALLSSDVYQDKTAWAIAIGIMRFLNAEQSDD